MAKIDGEDKLDNFFSILSDELNDKGGLNEERDFAVLRQKERAKKKARYVRPELRQQMFDDFLSTNLLVSNTRINVDLGILADARHWITFVLERLSTRLDPTNIQVTLDKNILLDLWRFGPGASNGIKGTHACEKISQKMSCTPRCVPLVQKLRQNNAYFTLHDIMEASSGFDVIRGSRLTTVPKNETTERTIAIEPSGNMCLQLAAGRYLELALASVGLDIKKQQPINKGLALRGSVDGSLATIDLSKASDMISLDLVRALLPDPWVELLEAIRSEEIEIPGKGWQKLHMVSTMGNGFTFPLMTLIIVALIYGYRSSKGGPSLFIDWSSTGVFGDDVIIPVKEYAEFVEILKQAGLVVNYDKSFSEGPFRESCGGDYYNGYDVTPFYVTSLDGLPEIYGTLNKVFEWSARNNILLVRSIMYLRSLLPENVLFVPEWHGACEGFRTTKVSRTYKHLYVTTPMKELQPSLFTMMLVCGGYVEGRKDHLCYSPRPFKTRWKVGKSRLPKGYLDGRDPLTRSSRVSAFIESYSFLLE